MTMVLQSVPDQNTRLEDTVTDGDRVSGVQESPPIISTHIEEAQRPCDEVDGMPVSILELYADIACRHDRLEQIEPGRWIATVAALEGVYGEGDTADAAHADLREAIIDWVIVKRRVGSTDIPAMEGLDLNPAGGPDGGEASESHQEA